MDMYYGGIGKVGTVASVLGGLTVLLMLGCADDRTIEGRPAGHRVMSSPVISGVPQESGQPSGQPPVAIFAPQQAPQQAEPQIIQNTEVAGTWAVTCEPVTADCPSFRLSLAPGGGIKNVEGLGAAKGYGQVRNGRLYISVKGIGEFEGVLDDSGTRAEGTLGHQKAVAVRGNPQCDRPDAYRFKTCR
jgi:hypothetical protein